MPALADLTPAELRARERAIKARIKRAQVALGRVNANKREAELILSGVEREIARRAKLVKGNVRGR